MYYGFYINLEKDKVKRDAIEYILSSNYIHSYKRFKAIDSETNLGPTMSLKGAEKGCFLSHYSILKSNINSNSIIHIVEDDAVFNHKIIKSANLISTIDDTQWDIIFTDVFVQPNPSFFCDLKDILDEYHKSQTLQIYNMKNKNLTGSTSYFINPKSIQKIVSLLEANISTNLAYDLLLRKLVDSGQLRASVTIPFFTYPRYFASKSSIRDLSDVDQLYMKLRESFWIDADLNKILYDTKELVKKFNFSIHTEIYAEFTKAVLEIK